MALRLTRREQEVAALVSEGETNRDIAGHLFISERTVEYHVEQAMNKLGLRSRTQLASWFIREELSGAQAADVELPVPITAFIGREKERATVERLLGTDRLVTVSGPGGVGKTRLALAVANGQSRWPRVRLADLAAVSDENHVAGEIAARLGTRNIKDAALVLKARPTLLVLDNCEHVVEAVSRAADVLLRSSDVVLLATSREPLNVQGERVFPLPPLELDEAVALFMNRALEQDLPRVDLEYICQRLERLPLAVELAAARTRLMSLSALRTSLDRSMRLLADGGIDRRRSLEASIRWSYDQLGASEQAAFRALSVFEGPFDLEAGAFTVAADESLILSFVDRSMLAREGDLYRLLYPVREFARAELRSAGEEAEVAARHDAYLVRWAAAQRDAVVVRNVETIRAIWSARDDIRAALGRLTYTRPADFATLAATFAATLNEYGDVPDANEIVQQAAAAAGDGHPQVAFVYAVAGTVSTVAGDYERALRELKLSWDLAAASGDRLVEIAARVVTALALSGLGRHDAALEELISDRAYIGPQLSAARDIIESDIALQYWLLGRYGEGAATARHVLRLAAARTPLQAGNFQVLALCLVELGDLDGAAKALMDSAEMLLALDLPSAAGDSLIVFGRFALAVGDHEQAALFVEAGHRLAVEFRQVWRIDILMRGDPAIAALLGDQPETTRPMSTLAWDDAVVAAIDWARQYA